MYAVIFTAEINEIDNEYSETAKRMRQLAFQDYGCTNVTATTEGTTEIAISYWPTIKQIHDWKQNIHHLKAQQLGQTKWYKSYTVEIVKILREYSGGGSKNNQHQINSDSTTATSNKELTRPKSEKDNNVTQD